MGVRSVRERPSRLLFAGRVSRPSAIVMLLIAITLLALGAVASVTIHTSQLKIASIVLVVLVLASPALSVRGVALLICAAAVAVLITLEVNGWSSGQVSWSGVVSMVIVAAVVLWQARRRARLGLRQMSAETVISLIGDRLLVQAELPELPGEWLVELEQRPADGAAISGDFVSNRVVVEGGRSILHLAIIDVSGSGISAGPRALLLSGAIGGLLGAVPPDEMLPAANAYLTRQRWSLGFASAAYLRLDLADGRYEVRVAGHPPPLHLRPDSDDPWQSSRATGTVLGVVEDLKVEVDANQLEPGDILVLFTDGVVEDRRRDIDAGLTRLKDRAELLQARRDWKDGAAFLVDSVPAKSDDDRTVVVIMRHSSTAHHHGGIAHGSTAYLGGEHVPPEA